MLNGTRIIRFDVHPTDLEFVFCPHRVHFLSGLSMTRRTERKQEQCTFGERILTAKPQIPDGIIHSESFFHFLHADTTVLGLFSRSFP